MVRERPSSSARSRSLGRRTPAGSRPSPMASRRAVASPAYAGRVRSRPTTSAMRVAVTVPVEARRLMQATLSRLAICSKANLAQTGPHDPDPARQPRPCAQLRAGRLPRRVGQLLVGLALYGVSMGLMIRSTLGQLPWDVLHYGLALHLPLSIGQVVVATSFLVLLLWIPLRQAPGLGTVLNAVLIGVALTAPCRGGRPGRTGRPGRVRPRRGSPQRPGDRALHRRAARAGAAGRPDDRLGAADRPVGPPRAHLARGARRGDRVAARRSGRHRHRPLRRRHRPAHPGAAALADRARRRPRQRRASGDDRRRRRGRPSPRRR